MNWSADSLHAVVFYPPTVDSPDALQPWLRIFGAPPQAYQSSSPGSPPGGSANGQVGAYQFVIVAQPGRTEMVISPPSVGDAPPSPIEDVDQALKVLTAYFPKLATSLASVRVALVLNLSKRVPSVQHAVAAFKKDTQLNTIPDSASDLQLALNVRKRFAVLPTEMNRLCRWSTGVQQFFTMQLTAGTVGPALSIQEFPTETLQIDLNCVPQTSQLQLQTAVAMFEEMAAEARIITAQGYERFVS